MSKESAAAGWYSDPRNEYAFRYWDGTAWTESGANSVEEVSRGGDLSADQETRAQPSLNKSKQLVALYVMGCVALFVGLLLLTTGRVEVEELVAWVIALALLLTPVVLIAWVWRSKKWRRQREDERELIRSGLGVLVGYPVKDRVPIKEAIEMGLIRKEEILPRGRVLWGFFFDSHTAWVNLPETLSPGRRVRVYVNPKGLRPKGGRGYIPQQTKFDVLRESGNRCVRCGSHDNLEIDHIRPIARGGTDEVHNLQVLCRRCNRSKGAGY